jgi:long-chain acyl-CoA synthetase
MTEAQFLPITIPSRSDRHHTSISEAFPRVMRITALPFCAVNTLQEDEMASTASPAGIVSVSTSTTAARASMLPVFFKRIAQQQREYVVYDNGWRGWKFSYAEIAEMAKALAARLRTERLRKGDHVLIWSESRPGWIAALWACLIEGIVLVPIEPQSSAALFQRIEQQIRPRLILLGDLPRLDRTCDVPVWHLRDVETCPSAVSHEPMDLSSDDVAEIVFTSGTTAEPKGVIMTHRNLAACLSPIEAQLAPYRKLFPLLAPLRALNLLPMSHLFGQAIAAFVIPLAPATVVFLNSANPEEIARQIRLRSVCALVSVPKMLEVMREFVLHRFPEIRSAHTKNSSLVQRLWRFRRIHSFFGWRFCCFIVGGAPLPAELEQFWSGLGYVVAQGYGLTETAPIISFNHPFRTQRGTAGKPMAGVQVRVADDGEILVRGDNVSPGYFQAPEQTSTSIQNGWLHTGDIGGFGPEGDLIIRGRKKDVIVTPEGLKVFPEDVEGVLNSLDGIRESAVLDSNGIHAVLVLKPGVNGENVIRQANQLLEPHQRIRTFSLWDQPELPRTATTRKLRRSQIVAAHITGKTASATPLVTNLLIEIVQKYAPGRNVTPDTCLDELGLTSLDRVELMLDLEEKLDIEIDDSALSLIRTVSELAKPVEEAKPIPQPAYNRTLLARVTRQILLPTVFLPLTRFFARIKVTGLEHLENVNEPVIFAANHQSYLDTPAILASLRSRWRYHIAPAMWMEYFDAHFSPDRYPIWKRWTHRVLYGLVTLLFNAFPLSQAETGTRQSLRYIGELVEEKWSILIFPEGERTMTGEIGTFYPGVAMIASRMRVPVIPIRLIGLDHVLHRHSAHLRRGSVDVRIGSPITLDGTDYRSLAKRVETAVRNL